MFKLAFFLRNYPLLQLHPKDHQALDLCIIALALISGKFQYEKYKNSTFTFTDSEKESHRYSVMVPLEVPLTTMFGNRVEQLIFIRVNNRLPAFVAKGHFGY